MKAFKFTRQAAKRMTCALLCVLTLTTVSCSQEEENAPEGAVKRVTATAAMPEDGLETRVVYPGGNTPQWEQSDVFSVWKENTETPSIFARTDDAGNSATAPFKGDIACKEGDQLYAVYPQSSSVGPGNQISVNVSSQTTGFSGNYRKHYMFAQSKLKSDGTVDFNFQHAVAMMSIEFTGTGKPHNFTLRADGLHTIGQLVITPEGFYYSNQKEGAIFVTGDFSQKKAFIFLLPDNLTNVNLMIQDANSNTVTVPLGDKSVEAGKAYTVSAEFSPVVAP